MDGLPLDCLPVPGNRRASPCVLLPGSGAWWLGRSQWVLNHCPPPLPFPPVLPGPLGGGCGYTVGCVGGCITAEVGVRARQAEDGGKLCCPGCGAGGGGRFGFRAPHALLRQVEQ
eukprot:11665770-Karenia_brevis.AAC.1